MAATQPHLPRVKKFWWGRRAPSAKGLGAPAQGGAALRSYMVMPGQPVWMDRNYAQFAQEAYVRNVIAHRAIDMVAQAAASVPLDAVQVNARGGRRELPGHAALRLLNRPNPQQSGAEFLQALYSYRLISGNALRGRRRCRWLIATRRGK